MMTNKEMSLAIRQELKTAGYKTRDFKISVKDSGYDTAIRVYIKNAGISQKSIESLLRHWEKIDYDARAMEILAGCNVYLFVEYESGVLEDVAKELVPISEMVLSNPEKYSGRKIAENETKKAFICQYNANEWILSEDEKVSGGKYEYKPTYWVRNAMELAIAMWRFKNIGTIYA